MSTKTPSVYERIYVTVREIPYGKVASYGQIARMVGGCTARMVGYAMASVTPEKEVPWHRVINSQGRISPRARTSGELLQKELLEEEGIQLDAEERIDFGTYGWELAPPVGRNS